MGVLDGTRFVERLQFFDGQRLLASDLQDIEAFNREMRWLHNRSLHQPGIGNGFAVYGKKGERAVTIGDGYALDALGREMVWTNGGLDPLSIPPVASENDGRSVFYDLTVSYPDDEDLEESEIRQGICDARGVVRLREAPVFCWVRLQRDDHGNLVVQSTALKARIVEGLAIVLARIEVLNCQLEADISTAERRTARASQQPYVAAGFEEPDWEWLASTESEDDTSASGLIILQADIDTRSAGFVNTPHYMARISGQRLITFQSGTDRVSASVLIDGLLSILPGARPDGFRVQVIVILLPVLRTVEGFKLDWFDGWKVEWVGIED